MAVDVVRPGPESIDAGSCPGGLVIHVYGVPSGRLLHVGPCSPADSMERRASSDADQVLGLLRTGEGMCLVFFDGDSGQRRHLEQPLTVYVCPLCGAVSYHPIDAVESYCGRCHRFAP